MPIGEVETTIEDLHIEVDAGVYIGEADVTVKLDLTKPCPGDRMTPPSPAECSIYDIEVTKVWLYAETTGDDENQDGISIECLKYILKKGKDGIVKSGWLEKRENQDDMQEQFSEEEHAQDEAAEDAHFDAKREEQYDKFEAEYEA